MKKLLILAASGAIACTLASGAQMIRYVSVDGTNNPPYTNWADAATSIDVAVTAANANNAGDIVWISNGPHVVTATINIGNTKVRGFTGDYRDVIVNGNGSTMASGAFRLTNAFSELSAVTVSNFVGLTKGGGVSLYPALSSQPAGMLSNCLITSCSAASGAAIYYSSSNSVVANCVIEYNTSSANSPFCCESGTAPIIHDTLVRRNVCQKNSAGGCGGGMFLNTQNAVVRDTTVSENTCAGSGGGVEVKYPALFVNCLIVSNSTTGALASGLGGGVSCMYAGADPVFSNCTISWNSATVGRGGGLYLKANCTLYNCVIAGNKSAFEGGGLYCNTYTTVVHNCTIVCNTITVNTDGYGGGLHNLSPGLVVLVNTIIYSNLVAFATSVNSNYNTSGGNIFTNCCTVPKPTTGTGNITDKPGLRNMTAGQFEPAADSPCINTGLNEAWMDGAVDLNGRQRLDRFTRMVDMGAYEYVYSGTLVGVR